MTKTKRVAELFNRFCEDAGELFDDEEPLPAAAYPVALDAACKRIAELEAERRWVEFSERLPEDSSSILIRYLHGEVVVGFWDGDDWHDHDGIAPSHVTHWMPLPPATELSDGH